MKCLVVLKREEVGRYNLYTTGDSTLFMHTVLYSCSHSTAILLEESYLFSHKSTRSTGRKELLLYWMGYLSPQVISPKEKVV